ncbi:MAG: sugar transferase [Syntrophothermus sp.]
MFNLLRSSLYHFCIDGLILSLFFYLEIIKIIAAAENITEKHLIMLTVIYLSWIFSAAATHKFQLTNSSKSKWEASTLQIKFYLLIIAIVLFSIYLLQIKSPEWIYFSKAVVNYSLVSGLLALFLFVEKINNKVDEPTITFLKAHDIKSPVISSTIKNHGLKYSFNSSVETKSIDKHKLGFKYLKEYEKVFSVLDSMIDLKSFDSRKSVIINSGEFFDISLQNSESYQLYVNLNVLNNQSNMNNYIRKVRKTLVKGGVFVGALYPHNYRYNRFIKKYHFWIGNLFYFFDFIWKRVFPKLPVTRKLYFKFRKEKDMAISLAEGLGRLVYLGFKILDIAVVDNIVYFAAVMCEGPLPGKKQFYSPIFKMERIGKGGKTIYVYKLRTMYPYAEFIQDYVFNSNGSTNGDKIINDFRLPFWGKLLRRYWLDELPMFINFLKGDIKIVGVRPLSLTKFNQYPKDLQELRISTTPGLIPPFYKDLPTSFEKLLESEKRYILAYKKNPIKTDLEYFFKALYNILIKKARSS